MLRTDFSTPLSQTDPESWALPKTHRALKYIRDHKPEVTWFYMSSHCGELDSPPLCIDVLIGLRSKLAITLQVKSREHDAEEFREEHPFKPVIVVKKEHSDMDVVEMIMETVRECYHCVQSLSLAEL